MTLELTLPAARQITGVLYLSQRLRQDLEGISAKPLTIVEAPIGYGKTVAVREFLRNSEARVIWAPVVSRAQMPNLAEDMFWKDFCRALDRAFPAEGETVRSLTRLGYPRDSVLIAAARELFLELDLTQKTVLVIDGYHLLPGPAFGRLCELLADGASDELHFVLITRDSYQGSRELLGLKGILHFIGRESFVLSPEDIQVYYSLAGINLGLAEAVALHEETGGWISALYLHLLRHASLGASFLPHTINALMEKEIYGPLSAGNKELLLSLCQLEHFTARQADFLCGGDATPLLAELSSKNSFVAYDEESGSFTLHSLFKQHVADMFICLPEERRSGILRKCAEWFVLEGELIAGIEIYARIGDAEKALTILEKDMEQNMVTEKAYFFNAMFQACPEAVLERHIGAAFKYAIAAFSSSDFKTFGEQCAWLARKCAVMPQGDREADIWRGELEFLYSLAAYNDIQAMSVHHRKANALLGRPTGLFGPESPWTLGCPSVLFMFYRESGKLRQEILDMRECLPHYYKLAAHHGAGGEYLLEAEAFYNAGEFTDAAIVCHKAEAMAAQYGQLGNVFCSMFLRMRLALLSGNFTEALRLGADMRGLVQKNRDYFLLYTVDLCEGWLYAALGKNWKMPAWLRPAGVSVTGPGEERLYSFAGGFYYIAHGRALIGCGDYTRTIGLFDHLLETGIFGNNMLFFVYAQIYIAAAYNGLGKGRLAEDALNKALCAALPDTVLMPFVENYEFLGPLFKDLLEKDTLGGLAIQDAPALLERIVNLGEAWKKNKRNVLQRHFEECDTPLTEREMELVKLSAEGKRYREIAESLRLAPSTVKKAFTIIYRKLGISSREELREYLARRAG